MMTKPVLVTGSTGYVGGRLVPKLLESGYRVRALGRSTAKLKARPWANHPLVELAAGDVLDYESLLKAAAGCRAAFYLVHSMGADPKGFSETDRTAAQYMARAAAEAGLEHIIYLGGLGNTEDPLLSKHLRSRHEVAEILQSGPVPATFLRAAMILGSGSASFEILRYLVDRLPIMVTPRWVYNPVQPIAIRNVLNYLQGCLEHEETRGQTFDIGGPEVVTYRQLFDIYAEEAHLFRRLIIPVPVLTPTLSSYWIHLITPVPSGIAKPLAEGLRNPVICKDNRIRAIIPQELLIAAKPSGWPWNGCSSSKSTPVGWMPAAPLPRNGPTVETPVMPAAPFWSAATRFRSRLPPKKSGSPSSGWEERQAIISATICGGCGAG